MDAFRFLACIFFRGSCSISSFTVVKEESSHMKHVQFQVGPCLITTLKDCWHKLILYDILGGPTKQGMPQLQTSSFKIGPIWRTQETFILDTNIDNNGTVLPDKDQKTLDRLRFHDHFLLQMCMTTDMQVSSTVLRNVAYRYKKMLSRIW